MFRTLFPMLALVFLCTALQAAEMTIDKDGTAIIDGKRTFVIGLYENPADDTVLGQVKKAGFNLVQSTPDVAGLDRLQTQSLHAWVNTGAWIDLSTDKDARAAQMDTFVKDLAGHPSMLVWEVPDEALWNNWHSPMLWRVEEVKVLREKLTALPDRQQAGTLGKQLEASQRLKNIGRYAESEAMADAIWTALGETSPNAGYGYGNAEERANVMAEGMLEGYTRLRKIDPKHPVWMNHAPRNSIAQLAHFNRAADIVGCDIYPVPGEPYGGHSDLPEQSIAATGAFTRRMAEAAPSKPVWMVLQGFGWPDIQPERKESEEVMKRLRRPTLPETRFMAYDSIVHGARGLLYWGTAFIEKDSQLWKDLLTVAAELSELQPALSAPPASSTLEVTLSPSFGSLERGVVHMGRQTEDALWVFVVNEAKEPLEARLSGLGAAKEAVEHSTGETIAIAEGVAVLHLAPQSVQILRVAS